MRNICLLFLLITSLVTTSCNKEDMGAVCGIASNDGKYELRSQTGGIIGKTVIYPAGNGNAYLFESSTYKLYTDGQLSKSGTYKVIQDSSFVLHQPASRIVFDSGNDMIRTLIQFSTKRMRIQEDVYDGRTYEYEKIE